MNRSWTNFAVDALIAAAFLLCAFTGILFLLPPSWLSALSLGRPGLLFVSYTLWHSLHDWSGVAAATGVVAHVFLHYRWIGKMAGKLGRPAAGDRRVVGARRPGATVGAADPGGSAAPQVISAAAARAAERAAARQAAHPKPASQAAGGPAGRRAGRETGAAARGPGGERRFSRKAFLSGAAATIGVAALGSIGLLSRSGTTLASTQSSSTTGTQSASASATTTKSTADASSSSTTSGASSGGATTTTVARVVVDENACVGCGACLRTCPRGVFSWTNAGVARATSADQCILCRRCLDVCRASAITLNA
jgi:L-aspartate semialdehyde sulfurtransferase ferredoxin